MKKLFFLLLITLVSITSIRAQIYAFEKGEIITKSNDTLHVFVELNPSYGSSVTYKKKEFAGREFSLDVSRIKYLLTPYNAYENIEYNNEERLFRISIYHNYSLYEYLEVTGIEPNNSGGTFLYGAPSIIYCIHYNGNDYFIKTKDDLIGYNELYENSPSVKSLLEDNSFKIENINQVVDRLNKSEEN